MIIKTIEQEIKSIESTDTFEIEFSETDRVTAKPYMDVHECLFCTAFRNRGINIVSAGGHTIDTELGIFRVSTRATKPQFNIHEHCDKDAEKAGVGPFWKPSVVGQKVTLHKIK